MEGIWTLEAIKDLPDLAKMYKRMLKEAGKWFTPEYVAKKISDITELSRIYDIVLVDLGGIPSEENRRIITEVKAKKKYLVLIETLHEKWRYLNEEWRKFVERLKEEGVIDDYIIVSRAWERPVVEQVEKWTLEKLG